MKGYLLCLQFILSCKVELKYHEQFLERAETLKTVVKKPVSAQQTLIADISA